MIVTRRMNLHINETPEGRHQKFFLSLLRLTDASAGITFLVEIVSKILSSFQMFQIKN